MSISHFRQLEVWQLAMNLAKHIYQLTVTFPRDERFGLTSQLQRAAISIPSNIAEGNARSSTKDYARFVSMALGSCAELQTQLLLSGELSFGDETAIKETLETCDRVGKMLTRLHQSLKRKIKFESPVPKSESVVY